MSGCLFEIFLGEDSSGFEQVLEVLLLSIGFAHYLLPSIVVVTDLLLLVLGQQPVLLDPFNCLQKKGL